MEKTILLCVLILNISPAFGAECDVEVYKCDGVQDCDNGEDEMNCPDKGQHGGKEWLLLLIILPVLLLIACCIVCCTQGDSYSEEPLRSNYLISWRFAFIPYLRHLPIINRVEMIRHPNQADVDRIRLAEADSLGDEESARGDETISTSGHSRINESSDGHREEESSRRSQTYSVNVTAPYMVL